MATAAKPSGSLSITALVAVRNEAANMGRCLAALAPCARVVVVDSHSTDGTADIARGAGADVMTFTYRGGYPKKRQWALDTLTFTTDWILLVDADEVVTEAVWDEIRAALRSPAADAYLLTKEFHFMGARLRWGGFSHAAVLLFRPGTARFEHLIDEPADAADMEVHERLLVTGRVGRLQAPLRHEDFKGLDAYIAKHTVYAAWEAQVRHQFLQTGQWGKQSIAMKLFGNVQERRRVLKGLVTRMPGEPLVWFVYHYLFRLGFLEGRRGWVASRLRARYIAQVRANLRRLQNAAR